MEVACVQHSTRDVDSTVKGRKKHLKKKKKKNQWVFLIWNLGSNNLVSELAKEKITKCLIFFNAWSFLEEITKKDTHQSLSELNQGNFQLFG